MLLLEDASAAQSGNGSLRGLVRDADFDAPLPGARVLLVETDQSALTTDEGNYLVSGVPAGTYTLVFSKDGYVRQVRSDVVVVEGRLTEVDAALSGDFEEMDEFVVQDVLLGAGSEQVLLDLRLSSPSFLDSIGSDLLSRAGAGDAASALELVSGATVQDGKFAVIRGLPDRYVSSQINGVRLPSADEDTRAVELDQFPSAVIESIQVSKTFTPDQQGDASGGAVNVVLKSIPEETFVQLKGQLGYGSQVAGRSDFLSYTGGGVSAWGIDDGRRDVQAVGTNWDGAVGVSREEAPLDYKLSAAAGGKSLLDNGLTFGGFGSVFYERDSSFYDNGIDDSFWVENPGAPLTPQTKQGSSTSGDFKTALFDVTKGSQSVQWGLLGTVGLAGESHSIDLTYLYTRSAEDVATLAEDTRGKEFFFPGYDPTDPTAPGNVAADINAAPYLRTETLQYTERTTGTLQLSGEHALPIDEVEVGAFTFLQPELGWTASTSTADMNQPDKRQFGSLFHAASFNQGAPPFVPPFTAPAVQLPFKPDANFTLGNLQRIYKEIEERSKQYAIDLKVPFEQWGGEEGYLKTGVFEDRVARKFDQDTFSNFNNNGISFNADFSVFWSQFFPTEGNHPITDGPPFVDVDYEGQLDVSAWYGMMDLPLTSNVSLVGGARLESTRIGIVNVPELNATWFPAGASAPVKLNPGDADVAFHQNDVLPAIGVVYEPTRDVTVRGSYSETVARQTFKELTPILQQEFLGGPIFIGNPELRMAALKNYDLRVDYRPTQGALLSGSYFFKDLEDPIEYVQRVTTFTFTTPRNFPKGKLQGVELEARQDLGRYWTSAEGLSVGANATFINSEVNLPDDEIAAFSASNILALTTKRHSTNAPEHLYNFYLTYDLDRIGTELSLFYTVKGETLIAGAGESNGNFVPNLYAKEFGTLNFSASYRVSDRVKLQFQAKNLTDPTIETVYRSDYSGPDATATSFTTGREYSLSLSVNL